MLLDHSDIRVPLTEGAFSLSHAGKSPKGARQDRPFSRVPHSGDQVGMQCSFRHRETPGQLAERKADQLMCTFPAFGYSTRGEPRPTALACGVCAVTEARDLDPNLDSGPAASGPAVRRHWRRGSAEDSGFPGVCGPAERSGV